MKGFLEEKARLTRRTIFDMKTRSGSGHVPTSLSCVDILVSLYYDKKTLFDPKQDVLMFGKAHGSPAVYPILADLGFFDKKELDKYCAPEGILRLHSDWTIPGCYFVGGSLGNGIGYLSGLAFAEKAKNYYMILGDAELYEGSVWESLVFIAHHNLHNVTLIVDRNGMGTIGETEKMLKLEPLSGKFKAFGLDVATINGHNFDELRATFSKKSTQPRVVIANTIKGKGVSYMEGDWRYHVIVPSDPEQIKQGLAELS